MAAFLWITFLILAVLGRVILQYRLTGDHGIRPAKPDSSVIIKISSLLLLLSFLAISTLVFLGASGRPQEYYIYSDAIYFLGVVLSVSGILVTVISQYQMGASWRIGVDEYESTDLITHGIYSYIRNPIYSGVIIFCIGLLLIIPGIYILISCVLLIVSIEIHVRFGEEPYLHKQHGDKFQKYIERTGRYLPRLVK